MDEVKTHIQNQGSVCSDSNGDDNSRSDGAADCRLCLVGSVAKDPNFRAVAEKFDVPVVSSKDGQEYAHDRSCTTIFVLDNFEGDVYNKLYKTKQPLLGPPAVRQLAQKNEKLPNNTRPLFNLAMTGVVVCFTGFRNKEELTKLVPLIHHMGGSIRKDMSAKVTHLIANFSGGDKYQYAATFRLPVMNLQWVYASWEHRNELDFVATSDIFVSQYKLKPFHGARVCFVGFPEEEEKHMTEILLHNGGTVTNLEDTTCTHVVVDESAVTEKPEVTSRTWVVKAEWFWTSVQKEACLIEKEYLLDDYLDKIFSPAARRDSHLATPSSASRRKRKRLQETFSSLVHTQSPALHKRRSSISDAGLLSVSGSFLDSTISPNKEILDVGEAGVDQTPRKGLTARHQVFLELLQTETNYVDILHTIMTMFKKHLEEMPEEEALLNNTELNLIFGKLPPIYETHVKMLDEFRWTSAHWNEERSIGNIIVKYSAELLKAYPQYINYFEEMKEVLLQCDQNKPRFHAFLKACQTKPECGRQSLQELMIRPVQRLGSISLLLNDILRNTQKNNPDHAALEQALAALREVMTHINEDKRKTEGQVTLFNIFNDIDNCPPDIVSSHRSFITKADVVQVSSNGLASKGNNLVLFLFSDQLEVCKKKSKAFNTLKSPSTTGTSSLQNKQITKQYKHIRLIALNTIRVIVDIRESEESQKQAFSICCWHNEDSKERRHSFTMVDEELDKTTFLKILTRTMANNACTADADKFLQIYDPHDVDVDASEVSNGTLSKAFRFATTRLKVGRAFSFNKTPSKLKRAVSSMMSPFGSSTNLTPASQLAQMKLASYSNLNELGNAENANESQPVAPLSVQPTRKVKASSLGVNSLKRL